MKKIFKITTVLIMLFIVFLFSFTACGSVDDKEDEQDTTVVEETKNEHESHNQDSLENATDQDSDSSEDEHRFTDRDEDDHSNGRVGGAVYNNGYVRLFFNLPLDENGEEEGNPTDYIMSIVNDKDLGQGNQKQFHTNLHLIVSEKCIDEKLKAELNDFNNDLKNTTLFIYQTDNSEEKGYSKRDDIEGLENINGSTCLCAAICHIAAETEEKDGDRNVIAVISDGDISDYEYLKYVDKSMIDNNVALYFLDAGQELDGKYLKNIKEIARESCGETQKIEDFAKYIVRTKSEDFEFDTNGDKFTKFAVFFRDDKGEKNPMGDVIVTDRSLLTSDDTSYLGKIKIDKEKEGETGSTTNATDTDPDSIATSETTEEETTEEETTEEETTEEETTEDETTEENSGNDIVENESKETKRWILILVILIAIVVSAVVVVIIILLSRKKKTNTQTNVSQNPKTLNAPGSSTGVNQNVTQYGNSTVGGIGSVGGGDIYPPHTQMRNTSNNSVSAKPAPQYGMPIVFEVRFKGTVIQQIQTKINGSVIVGRSNICDVMIDNTTISRQHFALEYDGESIYIQDLNTKNGTYLNGVRLTHKRRIEKEDKIRVGSLEIIVRW